MSEARLVVLLLASFAFASAHAQLPWQKTKGEINTAQWSAGARGMAKNMASDVISQALSDNTVVIFSKTSCSASNKIKAYFEDEGIPYYALELDQRADGPALSGALAEHKGARTMTGQVATPAVFIRGQLIGDWDVNKAAKSGELRHWIT